MKVRKSAVTLFLVLLGMVVVSGCGPVTVETPVPTPDVAATAKAAAATAVASQPTPDIADTVETAVAAALASQPPPDIAATYAAIATEIAITQATQVGPTDAAVVNAIRADQPPTIDGRLDEGIWSQAQPLTYAVHPPANDSTTVVVRLLWDDKYLYAGFDVSDTQVEGSSPTLFDGDSVSAIIDNGGQIQEYRHSLLADRSQSAPTGYHLKGTTTFDNPSDQDEGYSIEMRIPWVRTPAEGSTIAADFLSVDHDYNPGGLFNDRDTVFSKISWDGDASVDTVEKSIFLYVP